jgi:hypothetical protein
MRGSAPINVMLPFIFGVLLALVIFFTFVFPSLMRIIYGTCWGNTDNLLADLTSSMDRLQTGQSVKKNIVLGGCIGKLAFSNKNDLAGEKIDVACNPAYGSMIVITPNFKGIEKTEKDLKGVKAKCAQIPYKAVQGMQAYAYIQQGIVVLEGPGDNKFDASYCVEIKKTAENTYSVSSTAGGCT